LHDNTNVCVCMGERLPELPTEKRPPRKEGALPRLSGGGRPLVHEAVDVRPLLGGGRDGGPDLPQPAQVELGIDHVRPVLCGGQHFTPRPDHRAVAPRLVLAVRVARGAAGGHKGLLIAGARPLQQLPVRRAGDGVEGAGVD